MRKYWYLLLTLVILSGCGLTAPFEEKTDLPAPGGNDSSQGAQFPEPLRNLGPAPELTNEVWLNTDQPLRLADLRGKVVLLEMWTFG